MLPIASNGDRPRSAFEKRISKAVLISMLGPRLGAGSAVTTRDALVVWGGVVRTATWHSVWQGLGQEWVR